MHRTRSATAAGSSHGSGSAADTNPREEPRALRLKVTIPTLRLAERSTHQAWLVKEHVALANYELLEVVQEGKPTRER